MDNILIGQHFEKRAKELGINTAFLYQFIDSFYNNKNEYDTLKDYIRYAEYLAYSMGVEMSKSSDVMERKKAGYILVDTHQQIIELLKKDGWGYLGASNYFDLDKPLKKYQYNVWIDTINDVNKIQSMGKVNKFYAGKSFLKIVHLYLSEDLELYRDFSRLFENKIYLN